MAKLKKTPKQQMKYWAVGSKRLKIRARTARAAVRKYIRGSLGHQILIRDFELDNLFGYGEMPHEAMAEKKVRKSIKRKVSLCNVNNISVRPW